MHEHHIDDLVRRIKPVLKDPVKAKATDWRKEADKWADSFLRTPAAKF
jgi:hypothetical protein